MSIEAQERLKNTGRNDSCPCGSGNKYKKCHQAEDERASAEIKQREAAAALAAATAAAAEADADETKGEGIKATGKPGKPGDRVKRSKRDAVKLDGRSRGGSAKPSNLPRRSSV